MGTKNPKVSAYVPKALKDRVEKLAEERDISESQLVSIILAEYFQMPEVLGRSPEGSAVGGVTLGRMEALEERLLDFTASVESRLQALGEDIRKIAAIIVVHDKLLDETAEQADEIPTVDQRLELKPTAEGEQHDGLLSELPIEPSVKGAVDQESSLSSEPPQGQEIDTQANSLLNEPLEELPDQPDTGQVRETSSVEESVNLTTGQDVSETSEVSSTNSELLVDHQEMALGEDSVSGKDSSPGSELPKNSEEALPYHSELPFELKSEPSIEFSPLSSVKLSKRFGKGEQTVRRMRLKYRDDVEKFIEWNRGEDPDKIAWEHVPTSKGYVPLGELTQEQKASLQKWYKKNP